MVKIVFRSFTAGRELGTDAVAILSTDVVRARVCVCAQDATLKASGTNIAVRTTRESMLIVSPKPAGPDGPAKTNHRRSTTFQAEAFQAILIYV
jgi:hypothetical protein